MSEQIEQIEKTVHGVAGQIHTFLERRPIRSKIHEKYVLVKSKTKECCSRGIDNNTVSSEYKTKRALIVGINYPNTRNELTGCIEDAVDIYKMITKHYGFVDSNITLLIDQPHADAPTVKYDQKPTKKRIIACLKELVSQTKPGDLLFVHYSGHGSQVRCKCGDENTNDITPGMDDVIIPCDFGGHSSGYITDDDLREHVVNVLPAGATLRAFFDCCCSGTALDLPYVYKSGDRYQLQYDDSLKCKDCLLISGCMDNQSSADAYMDNKFNGALTWALKKALRSSRKMTMTWKDFLFLLRHHLETNGYVQVPVLSTGCTDVVKSNATL